MKGMQGKSLALQDLIMQNTKERMEQVFSINTKLVKMDQYLVRSDTSIDDFGKDLESLKKTQTKLWTT